MSKGVAVCKNCKKEIRGDFLELVKKVMAGFPCPDCGHQIGIVKNFTTREELKNEKNIND